MSIARLTAGTGVTRQAVTKHLRVMQEAHVVESRRQGRESLWQVDARRLQEARHWLDTISRQWDQKLSRLKDLVESTE